MPRKLSNIAITHISLVKAGANGKQPIYKSAAADPVHDTLIKIAKVDQERGVLYGIVYGPDQVDSQDEFASAEDIEKAAYGFMKSLSLKNVDREHDFENTDAYVAENWLIRKGDPLFPDEPEGAWAVGIKLESEALKKAAKDGDINGLSMAGEANVEEVSKAAETDAKNLVQMIAATFEDLWIEMRGRIAKTDKEGEDVNEKAVAEAIKKGMDPVTEMLGEMKKGMDALAGRMDDAEVQLKKSSQSITPPPEGEAENEEGGIL